MTDPVGVVRQDRAGQQAPDEFIVVGNRYRPQTDAVRALGDSGFAPADALTAQRSRKLRLVSAGRAWVHSGDLPTVTCQQSQWCGRILTGVAASHYFIASDKFRIYHWGADGRSLHEGFRHINCRAGIGSVSVGSDLFRVDVSNRCASDDHLDLIA